MKRLENRANFLTEKIQEQESLKKEIEKKYQLIPPI